MEKLLSVNQVLEYVPKSRTTIWRWVRQGYFPKPIPIGTTGKAWVQSEVEEWLQDQKEQRGAYE